MANMKGFLEYASGAGEEFQAKLAEMSREEIIALAAEKGFTLTDADFEPAEEEGEVSIDEADAISGGDPCRCTLTGTGKVDPDHVNFKEKKCKCVAVGWGHDTIGNGRCYCLGTGSGVHCGYLGGASHRHIL